MEQMDIIYNAILPLGNAAGHLAGRKEYDIIISSFAQRGYFPKENESLRKFTARQVFDTADSISDLELRSVVTENLIRILGSKGIVMTGIARETKEGVIRSIDTIRHWNGKSDNSLYDTLNQNFYSGAIR